MISQGSTSCARKLARQRARLSGRCRVTNATLRRRASLMQVWKIERGISSAAGGRGRPAAKSPIPIERIRQHEWKSEPTPANAEPLPDRPFAIGAREKVGGHAQQVDHVPDGGHVQR